MTACALNESGQADRPAASAKTTMKFLTVTTIATILIYGQELNRLTSRQACRVAASSPVTSQTQENANKSSAAVPHWHRPGCFQVGHTRTISIPGCVKFNLSTNACRGFCMSFSIPAAEDIGPPTSSPPITMEQLDGLLMSSQLGPAGHSSGAPGTIRNSPPMASNSAAESGELGEPSDDRKRMQKKSQHIGPLGPMMLASNGLGGGHKLGQQDLTSLTIGQKSPLLGAVGDTGDKRDVISVGQCCNMMETEDVTVNLRCGLNETRRLVFKSAKTCECFFCKHV